MPPLDKWLDGFLRRAIELVGAERGTILVTPAQGETTTRGRGMPQGPEALAVMAEIAQLATSKAGHRSTRVAYGVDHRPGMLVALAHGELNLGLLYLDRARRPFHDEDLRKLEAFCAQGALDLQKRLEAPPPPHEKVRQIRESIGQAASKVSLDDLEKKGFKQVKVLRAGDINQLILRCVQNVLARDPASGMREEQKRRILDEAKAEVDRQLADAKRLQDQLKQIEDANRRLEALLAERQVDASTADKAAGAMAKLRALKASSFGPGRRAPEQSDQELLRMELAEREERLQVLLTGMTHLLHESTQSRPERDAQRGLKLLQVGLSDLIRRVAGGRGGDVDFEVTPEAIGAIFAQQTAAQISVHENEVEILESGAVQADVDRRLADLRRMQAGSGPTPPPIEMTPEALGALFARAARDAGAPSAEEAEVVDSAFGSTAQPTTQSARLLDEVKPAEAPLSGSLLLMAAQDRELPAAEMAALEDRMELADPILQSEWEWLVRARAAVGAFEPARASISDLAALQKRIEAGLGAASVAEGAAALAHRLHELNPGATVEVAPHLRLPADDEVAFRARLEVDVARWIQHMPLPEREPSAATGLELAAGLDEAPGSASNAWGFVELEQGELFAWVLDVSGRGVESACFLLEAGAAFRAALEPGASPAAVLHRVNLALSREEAAMFASAILVRWDLAARKLTFASGGFEHAAVYRPARRKAELLRAEGIVLGLGRRIPGSVFRDREVELAPGDALLLHTSGVTDVAGGSPEAEQRALFAALVQHGERSASGILAGLREDLARRRGPVRHDDRTLLVIKRR